MFLVLAKFEKLGTPARVFQENLAESRLQGFLCVSVVRQAIVFAFSDIICMLFYDVTRILNVPEEQACRDNSYKQLFRE
jgi:hypothetical protein